MNEKRYFSGMSLAFCDRARVRHPRERAALLPPLTTRTSTMQRKTLLAAAVAGLGLATAGAQAQDEEKSPFTGSVGFYSDYIVRGVSQTNNRPALEANLDYNHSSGFYIGTFGSNVSWLEDGWEPAAPGVNSSVYGGAAGNSISATLEIDLYTGIKNKFAGDFLYEFRLNNGPGGNVGLKAGNTAEVYAGIGWKWFMAKVWYAITDGVFMIPRARGTYYANLSATFPIGETGFTLIGAVGTWRFAGTADYLQVANGGVGADNSVYNLNDFKIGVTKDAFGFTFGAFATGSTADLTFIGSTGSMSAAWGNKFGSNIGDQTFFVSAVKAF
jgi:uncharacterized protein (TIGR02001 family)